SYLRLLFLAAGPLEAAITDRALGVEVTPEQSAFVGYGSQERLMAVIGQTLAAASPWLLGERFSAADVYLGSQILFGLKFKTIAPQPAFQDYLQRLMARPAWQRATAADDALLPA
ncbi:MAG: glutathione binding-like protein, partial [Stenotrophomonas koreensis]